MKWSREDGAAATAEAAEPTTSLFAALQLGQRQDNFNVPMDLIVIDNVERPTED